MSEDGRMAGPGGRPPWYVFVLAALGVLLVLTAIVGIGPRASTMFPFTEPVPQPYRGPGVPEPTSSSLGDPTSVTTTTSSDHRAVAAPPAAGRPTSGATGSAPTTTTAAAPPTTTAPGQSTITLTYSNPGAGGYCCSGGSYGGGGYGGGYDGGSYGGGHHR